MNVQVLEIKPSKEFATFDIVVLMGEERHKFTVTVTTDTISNREIQIINGDDLFDKTFLLNAKVGADICKLVGKFHNNAPVQLPVDMGEFYPRKLESTVVPK